MTTPITRMFPPMLGLTQEGIDRANADTRERLSKIVPNPRSQGDSEEEIMRHVRTWLLSWIDRDYRATDTADAITVQGSTANALLALGYQIIEHPNYHHGRDPVAGAIAAGVMKAAGYLRATRTTRCPETRRYLAAAAAHHMTEAHTAYTADQTAQKGAA